MKYICLAAGIAGGILIGGAAFLVMKYGKDGRIRKLFSCGKEKPHTEIEITIPAEEAMCSER